MNASPGPEPTALSAQRGLRDPGAQRCVPRLAQGDVVTSWLWGIDNSQGDTCLCEQTEEGKGAAVTQHHVLNTTMEHLRNSASKATSWGRMPKPQAGEVLYTEDRHSTSSQQIPRTKCTEPLRVGLWLLLPFGQDKPPSPGTAGSFLGAAGRPPRRRIWCMQHESWCQEA